MAAAAARTVVAMASVAEFIQCDSRNYTAGRQGNRISKIVVHYTGTEASAHYFIDKDGTLRQSVSEGDTAWHAGDWGTNLCSVGIEVVSGGADFTEAQIETLAALVAEIRGRCGIGKDNVIRHYDVTGKLCPAPYVDGGKWAALHARICGGNGSGGSSYSGGGSVEGDVSDLARRVINGEFGNGEARKAALGDRYSEVQAEVNRILAGGGDSDSGGSSQSVDLDDLARRVINGNSVAGPSVFRQKTRRNRFRNPALQNP